MLYTWRWEIENVMKVTLTDKIKISFLVRHPSHACDKTNLVHLCCGSKKITFCTKSEPKNVFFVPNTGEYAFKTEFSISKFRF